jgi:hypothetical protein
LFASAPGSIEIPEDGYGWMDLEEYSKTKLENGMEVEIFTRNMGFGLNESQALVKRKRFRLVQHGDLQLLHYIRVPEGPQINPTMIKTRPRMVQGPRVMSPAAVNVPGQMTPQQVQQYNQRLEQQRKLLKMRQPPPVRILEDEKDPSGGFVC